jgi:hypothetical protein
MTRPAFEAFYDKTGVCRDYTHLAAAFCRCMNIPARYCTGYLGDIGVPSPYGPMDFAAWFEAFLDGHWYTFDARNTPRIGRILIARGRDASRRRDQQHVRSEHLDELQGTDRRGIAGPQPPVRLTTAGRRALRRSCESLRRAESRGGQTFGPAAFLIVLC